MSITQENWLDVGNLIVNEMFGDVILFVLCGMIYLSYQCLKFRVGWEVTIALNAIFACLTIVYAYNAFLWVFLLLVFGVAVYVFLPRLVKR